MIKKNSIAKRMLTSVMALFVAMMFTFSAEAASCKGKTQASCSVDNDCNWVNGFTRKDNVKVSGHCRAASGKKGSDKAVSKKADKNEKKSSDVESKKSNRNDDKDESDKKSKKDKADKVDDDEKKVKKDKKDKKDKKAKKNKKDKKAKKDKEAKKDKS